MSRLVIRSFYVSALTYENISHHCTNKCVMDSSCGISDEQSVGLSFGLGTCVLEQDASPSDGTLGYRSK